MKTTWEQVMALKSAGKNRTQESEPIANDLTRDELETIYATIDFFGGNYAQAQLEFEFCRYRVFDALAMYVQGRLEETPTKVLVYAFLQANGGASGTGWSSAQNTAAGGSGGTGGTGSNGGSGGLNR